MEQNHLLSDLQPELIHASAAKRFFNYIIDIVGYCVFIFLIMLFFVVFAPDLLEPNAYGEDSFEGFGWNMALLFMYYLYYVLFELATGGRTPGKLITGTRAVHTDGSRIDFTSSLKRNAIRFVPFEILSYFGSPCEPWHDRWADTMVMDIKQSNLGNF